MQSYKNGLERQGYEYRLVTPTLAEEWLGQSDLSFQRKLRPSHVKHLATMMEEGEFLTGCICKACVGDVGSFSWRLPNGMHTLHAIRDSMAEVLCSVEQWRCSDDAAYNSLFQSFDTENRQRSYLDLSCHTIRSGLVSSDTKPKTLALFQSGVTMIRSHSRGGKLPNLTMAAQYELALGRPEELDWLSELSLVADPKKQVFDRSAVVAAILCAFRLDRDKAEEFWQCVVTGMDKTGHGGQLQPAVKLRTKLMVWNLYTKGCNADKESVDATGMFIGCLRAWWAFVEGRELSCIYTVLKGVNGRNWLYEMCER